LKPPHAISAFLQAAAELNVTPAALSFQIKSLEEHLGTPVFRRLNRAVELTKTGIILANAATDGFATLNTAWRNGLAHQITAP
jgi:LysR family glycine cleavage system transcriptional activator